MDNLNAAIVVYSHYSRDARVRRYAESLAGKGFKVTVIALNEDYVPKKRNISIIKFPLPRIRLNRLWYVIEYLTFFLFSFYQLTIRSVSGLISGQQYKVVHINNMPDFLVFSAVVPKLFGSSVVLDMHDPMPELYISKYNAKENNLIIILLKWLEKLSMRFSNHVLTANDAFKDIFIKRKSCSKDNITVILNCPDPKIFHSQNIRRRADKNQQQFTLLYMGTVEKRFGLDIAIEALPALIKKIRNIKIIIIPKIEEEGNYFKNLKFKISRLAGRQANFKCRNHIRILKPQPLEKIAKQVKQADVGIVLAKNGTFTQHIFPVKLLEFIQMGIPVIASRTDMLTRYFKSNSLYFLGENNAANFTKAVLKLYKNRNLGKKLASNAFEYLKMNNLKEEEKRYIGVLKDKLKIIWD